MKSDIWLILEILVILAAIAIISYWFVPVYLAGVTTVVAILDKTITVLLGYKMGRTMPQQKAKVDVQ